MECWFSCRHFPPVNPRHHTWAVEWSRRFTAAGQSAMICGNCPAPVPGLSSSTFFLSMAAVDPAVSDAPAVALPGLARALVSAGKLGQKAAEDVHKKAQANRTRFIAELTGSGAVS